MIKLVSYRSLRGIVKFGCVTVVLGASLSIAVVSSNTQVLSQPSDSLPSFPIEQFTESSLLLGNSNNSTQSTTEADDVYLDGRRLFTVTAPVDSDSSGGWSGRSPIKIRVSTIEENLRQIVRDGIDPESIRVSTSFDEETGLPTVQVNDRYLMTITDTDSQFRGATYAELTQTIERGLIEAYEERQPRVLLRKGLFALSIAMGAIVGSFGLHKIRVNLVQSNRTIHAATATQVDRVSLSEKEQIIETGSEAELENTDEQENESSVGYAPSEELSTQASKLKLKYDLSTKALQIAEVAIWAGGAIGIANLFPYTRWITVVAFSTASGVALELLVIVVVTYLALRIAEFAIERLFAAIAGGHFITVDASPRLTQRIKTFSGVIKGAALVLITGVGTLIGLATIGIDIAPILAGAGILGLAVSFGSQSLVKDIINGFFILLEDQYGVGDVVSIDGSSGFVEKMNLRITQLRSGDGNLITVPNGSITVVENLTSHWSRVNLGIEVAYSTDLDKAIEIIGREARQMQRERYWRDLIVDEPEVLGVDGFGENSIVIRLWIKTLPLKHFEVGREYRKRIKKAFDREGISIPFPQRSIWFQNELTSGNGAADERKALSNRN